MLAGWPITKRCEPLGGVGVGGGVGVLRNAGLATGGTKSGGPVDGAEVGVEVGVEGDVDVGAGVGVEGLGATVGATVAEGGAVGSIGVAW